ncbi:MAG TPA: hypothetical protein VF874_18205 [Mycobacterium sp.]
MCPTLLQARQFAVAAHQRTPRDSGRLDPLADHLVAIDPLNTLHGGGGAGLQPARLMTGLLGGANYSMNQANDDLARLRLNALITRVPGRNRYRLTGDGLRFAIFYAKLHDRLLRPLLAADQLPAPPPLRKALHTIDIHITDHIDQARLMPNAA